MIRFSSACRQLFGSVSVSVSVSVPARTTPYPSSMRLQNVDAQYQQQRNKSSLSSENPWKVLGVPQNSCDETVRTAFMRLALRYHPDTSNGDTGDDFARIREAFERIRDKDNSRSGSNHGKKQSWLTEEVFNVFFEEHTGLRMDAATRREVMISYREGACKNAKTRTGCLPPAWHIAFILEEEGFFTKKLSCSKNAIQGPILPQLCSQTRRKRSF